jgi:Ni/Fe-hydrogenase subunit HybB-like protein
VNVRSAAVGGPLLTRPFRVLAALFLLGAGLMVWRLFAGLGATTALSDAYPWGIWIAFDVVTGTALACGGYSMAILVYILNKGRYHPMVRPAILTSALGYTIAGISIAIDIGRPWIAWKVPVFVWSWNLNSALLEVSLCIMTYTCVAWIELSPIFLERWSAGPEGRLRKLAEKANAILKRWMIWIIAFGLLLPTMHQSSLGTLMVLTGRKLHPLWQTPLLPLLFLISCIAMGYAAVVLESTLASAFFGRPRETDMLAGLSRAMLPVLGAFFLLRIGDLALRGRLPLTLVPNRYALAFWLEIALAVAPFFLLLPAARRRDPGNIFRAAMTMLLAGGLYRFNAFLITYRPGDDIHYFPSVPEFLISVGLVALEILGYIVIVKKFPILSGAPRRTAAQT